MSGESDTELAMIERAAEALSEHFDSVLILTTSGEGGDTARCWVGRGNSLASYGAARLWLRHREREDAEAARGVD